jgi:hypothetical protein
VRGKGGRHYWNLGRLPERSRLSFVKSVYFSTSGFYSSFAVLYHLPPPALQLVPWKKQQNNHKLPSHLSLVIILVTPKLYCLPPASSPACDGEEQQNNHELPSHFITSHHMSGYCFAHLSPKFGEISSVYSGSRL